jgi:hypothetical protein
LGMKSRAPRPSTKAKPRRAPRSRYGFPGSADLKQFAAGGAFFYG